MGYMIAAYSITIASVAAYASYLALERRRLRGLLRESDGVASKADSSTR